jgi:hypothetical protein
VRLAERDKITGGTASESLNWRYLGCARTRKQTPLCETVQQATTFQIPATIWNQESDAYLVFEFPDAISPLAAGVSQDSRQISCGFTRIRFEESNVAPSD